MKKYIDVRLGIPKKARERLKTLADSKFLTVQAYIRTIIADKLKEAE